MSPPYIVVLVLCNILITLLLVTQATAPTQKPYKPHNTNPYIQSESCSQNTCGAIDPVNDPDYNVREVIKNTLLIEQHLADKNKYCKQCLVKHFLISIGLLEEGIWTAGCKCREYFMLEESLPFYNDVFNVWKVHKDSDDVRLETLTKLREWRRKMIDAYYF